MRTSPPTVSLTLDQLASHAASLIADDSRYILGIAGALEPGNRQLHRQFRRNWTHAAPSSRWTAFTLPIGNSTDSAGVNKKALRNFRRRRIRGASTPPPIGRFHCVRARLRSRDRRINRQRNRCRASNTADRHRGKLSPPTKRQLATSTSGDRHRLVPRGSGGDTHAAVDETPQPLREEFRSGRGLGETGGSTERRHDRSGQVTCGSDRGNPHVTAEVRQLPVPTRHPTERRRLRQFGLKALFKSNSYLHTYVRTDYLSTIILGATNSTAGRRRQFVSSVKLDSCAANRFSTFAVIRSVKGSR